jgi:prephenate dehydrogenase
MGNLLIVGLGLIGSSMGLALKRAAPVETEVVGFDIDPQIAARAHKIGAVSHLAPSLEGAAKDATLVVVATPVISIQKVFATIAPHLQKGAVVTDTASTKVNVLRWAQDTLPASVHFIGGHPMAGKEKSGPAAAEETLFDDRPYAIVPSLDTAPGAVNAVFGLAEAIGSHPFFLDAEEHDAYAAAISHVPLASSIALFNLVRKSPAWPELANMAGPAFYDLTRLASGTPEMSHDIFLTNREHVIHWLDRYMDELYHLRNLIAESDPETLYRTIAETQLERDTFVVSPPKRKEQGANVDLPSATEAFMGMIAGGWIKRQKEVTEAIEEQQRQREREERLRRRDV